VECGQSLSRALVFKETERAAQTLRIEIQSLELRGPDDLRSALQAAIRQMHEALIMVEDPLTIDFQNRLPAKDGFREFVNAGGLMSYGASLSDMLRRAARYIDKVLGGAKPSELPVEQPTKFELLINLKTAKALSLDVPPILLARADEAIE
jgi:putative ABC transport system substrate-binding protein